MAWTAFFSKRRRPQDDGGGSGQETPNAASSQEIQPAKATQDTGITPAAIQLVTEEEFNPRNLRFIIVMACMYTGVFIIGLVCRLCVEWGRALGASYS